MKRWGKALVIAVPLLGVLAAATVFFMRHTFPVLQPTGEVGIKERNLLLFTVALSAVVVIPVFTLLILFAVRYREGGRGKYDAKLEGNRKAEAIWWAVPAVLIFVIATVTWRSSYALDPFKPLGDNTLHIQVVALDWKWLFIYPGENIARVGVVDVPTGVPVEFDLTSDAVMSSFWVPSLGGQMYAMPGMQTKLNLRADKAGDYNGVAANISGEGFADMTFTVHALPSQQAYNQWVQVMQRLPNHLTANAYSQLAQPGTVSDPNSEAKYGYSAVEPQLYNKIIDKYMTPNGSAE